ncbi:MAG: T9SS type A sorting domain-containing protein [Bacteroidota bacterium]
MPGVTEIGQNELWSVDINSGTESMVKNISTETRSLSWNEHGFVKFKGQLYLYGGGEVWKTDGSPAGTMQLAREDIEQFMTLSRFIPDFEELHLFGVVSRPNGANVYALAQVDGNRLIKKWEGALGSDRGVKYLTRIGNEAVFSASPINFSFDLTHGVTQLNQPFSSTFPKGFSSLNREYLWPQHYTVVGDRLFIRGADGQGSSNWDIEPWVVNLSDGSASLIKDINPELNSFPREFTAFDGQVAFNAREPFHRESIYLTDGTPDGTIIFFEDFTDANEETSISNLITIRDSLYFNSLHRDTQRFITVGHDRNFTVLEEKEAPSQSQFSDFAEEIFEMGYFLVHYDGDEAQRAYDVASNSFREVDWSMLPTRHIELGNYFFDARSYGPISRWDKLTLEEEIYSDDPNGELPYTTLGSKLIIFKYAEGFGHELWALDIGRQDRMAHLEEMEVLAGKLFLPYISDIETAEFTFSLSTPDAITYEDGRFKGVIDGEHTLDLHFEEDEIYNAGTISITIEVSGQTVAGLDPLPELKVYPNPTSDRLTVSAPHIGLARMTVTDLSGRLWDEPLIGVVNTSFELGHLPEGLYILQVESIDGRRTARKILVQR